MTSSTKIIAKFEAAFEAFETTDKRPTDLYVTQIVSIVHHLKLLPVSAEEAEGPGPHDISLQCVQSHKPVQAIVCLLQVQEYYVEGRFPHGHNLLKQFDLDFFGPRTASRPEPMEGVVVGDGGGEAAIEYYLHRLPHHLHDTYSAVLSAPFGGYYYRLPGFLLC